MSVRRALLSLGPNDDPGSAGGRAYLQRAGGAWYLIPGPELRAALYEAEESECARLEAAGYPHDPLAWS